MPSPLTKATDVWAFTLEVDSKDMQRGPSDFAVCLSM